MALFSSRVEGRIKGLRTQVNKLLRRLVVDNNSHYETSTPLKIEDKNHNLQSTTGGAATEEYERKRNGKVR